jgi:hypothetical protein
MHLRPDSALDTRIAEALMLAFFPCDLGDGIEVIHDVEEVEIEMDCDLDDDGYSAPYETIELVCEAAASMPAFEHLSLGMLDLDDFERSTVWDTLPFER